MHTTLAAIPSACSCWGIQQREHHLCRGQPRWMERGKKMPEKWDKKMATAEMITTCGRQTKASSSVAEWRVPRLGLPPAFSSFSCGKPYKPIINLITCAQLCPQCDDLIVDKVLLSSALAACFMCLVQHVPRRVAGFGSCVTV